MCTELEQLAGLHCHMNWTIFPKERDWKQVREADAQLACKLEVGKPANMWQNHPGKFVLILLNVLNLCCRNCLL